MGRHGAGHHCRAEGVLVRTAYRDVRFAKLRGLGTVRTNTDAIFALARGPAK